MDKTERKMRARRTVYKFLAAWSTLIENPEEDIPQQIVEEGTYDCEGLTPEDISEAAKFVTDRIYRHQRDYTEKIQKRVQGSGG